MKQRALILALAGLTMTASTAAMADVVVKLGFAGPLTGPVSHLGKDEQFLYDTLRFKGEILNALGRYEEAKAVYQQVLDNAMVPWARMGLAIALRGMDALAEAEMIGTSIIDDFPEYLAAYDFVANVREEMGKLAEAQETLQKASAISPNNSVRQRMVAEIAVRNDDLDVAERAYSKVLERHRGSSLRVIDDYTNLTRVMLDRDVDGVPIVNETGVLLGFVSRSDILRAVVTDPPLSMWR